MRAPPRATPTRVRAEGDGTRASASCEKGAKMARVPFPDWMLSKASKWTTVPAGKPLSVMS
jgi:hypothetical protein